MYDSAIKEIEGELMNKRDLANELQNEVNVM
jgi:hypothetical protein